MTLQLNTTLARWSVALTSGAAAVAGAAFAAAYSSIEHNDAQWNRLKLPSATTLFAHAAPIAIGFALVLLVLNVIAAARRNDNGTIVGACVAWLFAFAWVLACLIAWRLPYMLIGERVNL